MSATSASGRRGEHAGRSSGRAARSMTPDDFGGRATHSVSTVCKRRPSSWARPCEGGQLDEEREPDDDPAEPFDEAGRGRGGAAGRDHVVDDEHPLARVHGVAVDLEEVGAVLERVLLALDLPRQLARPCARARTRAAAVGDRRREDEAARFDAEHLVDRLVGERRREGVDGRREGVGGGQQRRDVAEDDARLGPVGDIAHELPQRGGVDHLSRLPAVFMRLDLRPSIARAARSTSGPPDQRLAGATCASGGVAGGRGAESARLIGGGPPGTPPMFAGASTCSPSSSTSSPLPAVTVETIAPEPAPVATAAATSGCDRGRRACRSRSARYCGSRSFHQARSGAATKIDEYEPMNRPASKASAKSSSDGRAEDPAPDDEQREHRHAARRTRSTANASAPGSASG